MNKDIYTIDYLRSLPESLKNDPSMLGLASSIGSSLQGVANSIKNNIIYARIDELNEDILDVLAYDLHIDWYDYSYPIDVKRDLIKNSVKVHKRLGTKYAVETALGGLHPKSYIEEWFEYEGLPRRFRVVIDTTNSKLTADSSQLTKAVNVYKRKTAIMESLIYQCLVSSGISYSTEWFAFNSAACGKLNAGQYPQVNTVAGVEKDDVDVLAKTDAFNYLSKLAGTSPERSVLADNNSAGASSAVTATSYGYNVKMCGTSVCKT